MRVFSWNRVKIRWPERTGDPSPPVPRDGRADTRPDPLGPAESTFRTETRAVATDSGARARFRRYWSILSPGIILIRWLSLGPLKVEAERRARLVETGSAEGLMSREGGGGEHT
jgi:hypothetical protein